MTDHTMGVRHAIDALAAGVAISSWAGFLPQVASVISVGWLLYSIGKEVYAHFKRRRSINSQIGGD